MLVTLTREMGLAYGFFEWICCLIAIKSIICTSVGALSSAKHRLETQHSLISVGTAKTLGVGVETLKAMEMLVDELS
jgi:hypothetical protein